MKYIASVSFGKDSLYMLLRLIETGAPLDEVVFYDTGMEFQAIYDIRDAVQPLLAAHGVTYTELTPVRPFLYDMFEKPIYSKKNGHHCGYSWCGKNARWGTTFKQAALEKNARKYTDGFMQYIGIAADEPIRLARLSENKIAPLAEWEVTEAMALQGCYDAGFDWLENGQRLYDPLDRVSCWCCANKNLKELRNIYHQLPGYRARLKDLQSRTDRPMKGPGKSVFDLEARFAVEDIKALTKFYKELHQQSFLELATGEHLDKLAAMHGFSREHGEKDTAFRERLKTQIIEQEAVQREP